MAQTKDGFTIIGPIKHLSYYKMRGIDNMIVRRKGGATKKEIKTKACFKKTREINAEFGGRSVACRYINRALHPHKALADYNYAGVLNALVKPIQKMDTENVVGRRSVWITRSPQLLEGFNLNKQNTFDSMVRSPLVYTLSKDTGSAQISIPQLLPDINFFPPDRHPLYGFSISIGTVPDLNYFDLGKRYKPVGNFAALKAEVQTEWYPVLNGSPALEFELKTKYFGDPAHFSIMLSIGLRFGTMENSTTIQQAKYAGAAKILAMD